MKTTRRTSAARQVARLLTARDLTAATAESCTGGHVAARLTAVAGASAWFRGGVVSYATAVKEEVLGVVLKDGVVSEDTARQMAEGAARLMQADCAVATTGVAGPTGGTALTPVGTVCIAATLHGQTTARTIHFDGTRREVVLQATDAALHMLAEIIDTAQ